MCVRVCVCACVCICVLRMCTCHSLRMASTCSPNKLEKRPPYSSKTLVSLVKLLLMPFWEVFRPDHEWSRERRGFSDVDDLLPLCM